LSDGEEAVGVPAPGVFLQMVKMVWKEKSVSDDGMKGEEGRRQKSRRTAMKFRWISAPTGYGSVQTAT
jgi:hypothetical protein